MLTEAVDSALKHMKNCEGAGNNGETIELLKQAGPGTWKILANIHTSCLGQRPIPNEWNNVIMLLI